MAMSINKAEIMAKVKKVLGVARKHLISLLSAVVAIGAGVLAVVVVTEAFSRYWGASGGRLTQSEPW